MEKFEYKFLTIEPIGNKQIQIENMLNELGNDGWELVNFQRTDGYISYMFIFKRKK